MHAARSSSLWVEVGGEWALGGWPVGVPVQIHARGTPRLRGTGR
jgi:hypothetical protein